jgi:hypothetical protein
MSMMRTPESGRRAGLSLGLVMGLCLEMLLQRARSEQKETLTEKGPVEWDTRATGRHRDTWYLTARLDGTSDHV